MALLRFFFLFTSMIYSDTSKANMDVLRPRTFVRGDVPTVLVGLGLANAVHLWSLLEA